MSKTRFAYVLILNVLVGGVACGGGGSSQEETTADTSGSETTVEATPEPPPPPPPRPVPVRVLNLAPTTAETPVTATAGTADAPMGQIDGVAYKSASTYAELNPGSEEATVPVTVTAGQATATLEAPVRAGTPATLIVVSNPQSPGEIVLTATEDDPTTVMGQIRGRFVNALVGTETIDFCLPGERPRDPGRPIFTGVQYGQVAGTSLPNHYIPISVASGAHLQIRQGAERGCTGRVIGTVDIPAPDPNQAHNMTLAVVGRATGRPAVPRELVVCEDAPGESACNAIPLH